MPRIRGPRKIARYSNKFKVKAVRLTFIAGAQVQEVAAALDIHPFMLSRWRKEYREGKLVADRRVKKVLEEARSMVGDNRLKTLEQENAKLKVENDLLKKAGLRGILWVKNWDSHAATHYNSSTLLPSWQA